MGNRVKLDDSVNLLAEGGRAGGIGGDSQLNEIGEEGQLSGEAVTRAVKRAWDQLWMTLLKSRNRCVQL